MPWPTRKNRCDATATRVLVTGSSGLLGIKLMGTLKAYYEVLGIDRIDSDGQSRVVDITDNMQVASVIGEFAPDVVVHTAAETNVDRCEVDRDHARRVNTDATSYIVDGSARSGARLVFISTDYVFDGVKGYYVETDPANPINYYGETKLKAEELVRRSPNSLVIRTSVLYGWHPTKLNFATWVLDGLRQHNTMSIVSDHFNSPTLADNLAETIKLTIIRKSQGLLHVAGGERISRFDFARRIAESFDLDKNLLVPVEMRDLDWVAKRPRDSSLDVAKAQKELGVELLGVDSGLAEMLRTKP